MSEYVVTAQPAEEPVTLAEARRHCRVFVEDADEDAYISSLIVAARGWVEAATCRSLVTRTLKVRLDSFPSECRPGTYAYAGRFPAFLVGHTRHDHIELLYPPLQSVVSIVYGPDSTALDPSAYTVVPGTPGLIEPASDGWPDSDGPVVITFTAGYGAASEVPQGAKLAISMLVSAWYEQRAAISQANLLKVPFAVDALLATLRWGAYV